MKEAKEKLAAVRKVRKVRSVANAEIAVSEGKGEVASPPRTRRR